MKNIAFTIAFNEKYKIMARALKASIERYCKDLEFIIYSDGDFTPYEKGLPKDRHLYPKDYKYPKLEILSLMKDSDIRYMFLDADSLVFGDIYEYFNLINPGELMIEYVYCGNSGWAKRGKYDFVKACQKSGLNNMEPYSINSGFILWQGEQKCFEKSLELIKNYTFEDKKGKTGDEYYLCAGIQLAGTNVIPINYDNIKLGKYWNGNIALKDNYLVCDYYNNDKKLIVHYGNNNYYNHSVRTGIKEYTDCTFEFSDYFIYKWLQIRKLLSILINNSIKYISI